ncbi:MAG: hypothetical protein HOI80_05785 [Alphaproteobacteria bacterium]|nr:hypothetical protein [Alphaproteobacteria bacterium]
MYKCILSYMAIIFAVFSLCVSVSQADELDEDSTENRNHSSSVSSAGSQNENLLTNISSAGLMPKIFPFLHRRDIDNLLQVCTGFSKDFETYEKEKIDTYLLSAFPRDSMLEYEEFVGDRGVKGGKGWVIKYSDDELEGVYINLQLETSYNYLINTIIKKNNQIGVSVSDVFGNDDTMGLIFDCLSMSDRCNFSQTCTKYHAALDHYEEARIKNYIALGSTKTSGLELLDFDRVSGYVYMSPDEDYQEESFKSCNDNLISIINEYMNSQNKNLKEIIFIIRSYSRLYSDLLSRKALEGTSHIDLASILLEIFPEQSLTLRVAITHLYSGFRVISTDHGMDVFKAGLKLGVSSFIDELHKKYVTFDEMPSKPEATHIVVSQDELMEKSVQIDSAFVNSPQTLVVDVNGKPKLSHVAE